MSEELIEQGKRKAAIKAVRENIKKNMILGIGSGSTVVYALREIAEMDKSEHLNLKCIPSSFQSSQLIIENELPMVSLNQYPEVDLDIDGADEIDKNLNLIKGGGGCLVQEKILASNSKKFIIIADFRKNSKNLGENWRNGIPIEVIPMAYVPVMKKLEQLGGKPKLRIAKAKLGPVVTDNGNLILDVDFGIIENPLEQNLELLRISGIVDTGLFINMTSKAYIGQKDGNVLVIQK